MRNYDDEQSQAYDYRGKRALVLLRVSTEEQERKYGFPAQLRSIREKLIEPLGLRLPDETTHIVRDTYTGMEFSERKVLQKILEMAKGKAFDVLVMDVLDRLGRTGMPREIYRAELKMLGIHVLTTKEEEHADDDSMLGQMIRLWNGWKSEGERNDIIRRTQNGKRERVLKDHMLMGSHDPKYGWKYKNEKRGAYILNHDPLIINGTVLRDENGEPWTEAKIRRYIVDLADNGETMRGIARKLTNMHIPNRRGKIWNKTRVEEYLNDRDRRLNIDTPVLAYGFITVFDEQNNPYTQASITRLICEMHDQGIEAKEIAKQLTEKGIPTGRESEWHPASINVMVADEFLIGKAVTFRYHRVKEPGKKTRRSVQAPESEWIYLPEGTVEPLLVTENGEPDIALYERVCERMQMNQKKSARNNHCTERFLLYGGLAKCGHCGGKMTTRHKEQTRHNTRKPEKRYEWYQYLCPKAVRITKLGACVRNIIDQGLLDDAAWAKAVELIRNPTVVDKEVEARKTEDPNAGRRQIIKDELAKIKTTRATLTLRLEDPELDDDSYADVKRRLRELKNDKDALEKEQSVQIDIHEEWKKAQQKLTNFHKRCAEMRDKLNDPEFKTDFAFKREAIEFFWNRGGSVAHR
jgi:DNA invertase Pin-like site-specific DNA recombinase